MYKIIGADGIEYGPVSLDQIRQWIAEGRLNATSKVRLDGSSEWKQLRETPEFSTLLPGTPPPPITIPSATTTFTHGGSRTNALAGWSLGLGIASVIPCCCTFIVPGIAAIILGAMALSEIKKNPNQGGRGMAIAGIVLGSIALLCGGLSWIIYLVGGASNSNGFPPGFPFRH